MLSNEGETCFGTARKMPGCCVRCDAVVPDCASILVVLLFPQLSDVIAVFGYYKVASPLLNLFS
jgi:hypothetical protein